MTIDDFRRILIDCAGESEAELGADLLDTRFEEIGYDSLALLESAARIYDEFGVRIPEEIIHELETYRHVLEFVNSVPVEAR
jgi:minimal PKS acyl carrier protein